MRWLLAIIALLLAIGFILWWQWWYGEPVSRAALGRLAPGMTSNVVVSVLGQPLRCNTNGEWVYSRRFTYNYLLVSFDEQGRLIRYAIRD